VVLAEASHSVRVGQGQGAFRNPGAGDGQLARHEAEAVNPGKLGRLCWPDLQFPDHALTASNISGNVKDHLRLVFTGGDCPAEAGRRQTANATSRPFGAVTRRSRSATTVIATDSTPRDRQPQDGVTFRPTADVARAPGMAM
jgi:hypothetical protein